MVSKGRLVHVGSSMVSSRSKRELVSFQKLVEIAQLVRDNTTPESVQEYIVQQEFDSLSDQEVDFFAPQISVLLALFPLSSERDSLRSLVLHRCAHSLHCAMKFVWYFNAMSEYADQALKERCLDLSRVCEVAVVNSSPPDLSGSRPTGDFSFTSSSRRPSESEHTLGPNLEMFQRVDALEKRIVKVNEILVELSDRLNIHEKPQPQEMRSKRYRRSSTSNAVLSAEEHSSAGLQRSFSQTSLESHAVIQPQSEEFSMFLAKQNRAHFFTSQLDLFLHLELISNQLVDRPRELRKEFLQKYLTVLDFNIAGQGLYFPNCRACDPHYKILRIVAEESIPLNSRDKVPFLMPIEICYTGKVCSDPTIYEEMDEIELVHDPERHVKLQQKQESKKNQSNNPLGKPFGELLSERKKRLQNTSPFGTMKGWDLMTVIVKVGDDCRQEELAMQMIEEIDCIFKAAKLPLRLHPFHVLVTSPVTGIVEVVPNATSIDSLKKDTPGFESLLWFFENYFGPRGSQPFQEAQAKFIESMAAYSLVTYLLQIKDRHNGNIMLNSEGSVIHIDFGFFLSNSPGGNWAFEQAPFKLTEEYVQVMEGEDSDSFALFKLLMIRGFLELRRHVDKIVCLAEIVMQGPKMPCFYAGEASIADLRARFQADKSEQECIQFVYSLIEESVNNWRSIEYDRYQRITNGIW